MFPQEMMKEFYAGLAGKSVHSYDAGRIFCINSIINPKR